MPERACTEQPATVLGAPHPERGTVCIDCNEVWPCDSARIAKALTFHGRDETAQDVCWCCGVFWPCPTAEALGVGNLNADMNGDDL